MTTPSFQIAIDCADPHRLARFWAAAMDLEVEDHHDQVRGLLDQGLVTDDDTVEVEGRLAFREAAACRGADGHPRLLFQVVPEPKTTKNRVHLDLHVGEDRNAEEVARMQSLGATRIGAGSQGPHSWVVMADPEGNEFCVA